MQVIPVIDLMGGQVVRAKMGDRETYQPIKTPLSLTSDPVDVVQGLIGLAYFPILYIADLDAIQNKGNNFHTLSRLRERFPNLVFWLDNGAANISDLEAARHFAVPVLGSESQRDMALLQSQGDVVLSLDFRGNEFLGPPDIWRFPDAWPERILVMTLARVGANLGPDLDRIAIVRQRAGNRKIYAAGGLRDVGDLARLQKAGVSGVLVASALHDGRLKAGDIPVTTSVA